MENIIKVSQYFRKHTSHLSEYIVLVIVHAERYHETNMDLLKYLIAELKEPGVYVTLNKPYATMQRLMRQDGIDERMVIFIDTVTKTRRSLSKKVPHCLYIGSPEKLSDLALAIDQAVKSIKGERKFIFFDSLNTLAIFNNQAIVAKFVHFLTVKMREWRVKGVIISLRKETDDRIINHLTQLCDAKIDIDDKEH